MRRLTIFCLLIQSFFIFAQTTEDFDDEDFGDGVPLTWTASQTSGGNDFVIASGELQSNGPSATGSLFISTNLGIDFNSNDVIWTFKTRYDGGAPSSSNFIEIYLMSDVADVSGSPNGYYIRLGESGSTDGIDLFSTNSGTAIISDAGDQVAAGIDVHIRVTRTGTGDWTLEADPTGGDTFSTIGTVTNTDFTSGDFFGFFVRHSSTRNQDFFFDDVVITSTLIPDTTPPSIQSATAISETQVDVLFSESVDQTTAETATNYALDGSVTVITAVRDASNMALVHLTTSAMTNGETYTITVNNVEDENSNAITANSQASYEYLVIEEAEAGDVVVNEFYAAPSADSAIPDKEFIELLNISDKFIQLENWTFSDASGTSSALTSFRLDPNEYVILTNTGNGALFNSYGDVLEVANFRALNNGGDEITISNAADVDIYSITYTSSTSGITTELINPNGPDYSLNNYGQSTDPDGGTPGEINSIFDDTPDTTSPTIESISVVSSTALDVTFSETLQEPSANTSTNYAIDGGISVANAERDAENNALVHLMVSELVSGDIRTLTINNVSDLSGNAIDANSTIEFEYILTETADERDLVINEFYAAPSSDSAIPNVEYVEVFNRSEKFVDLENWTLSDQSGPSSPLGSFIIRPDSFVILAETDNGALFDSYGDWVEVGNFPTLNNGGDSIIISNASSLIIHEIKYSESTSGISTELINPNGPDYSFRNYEQSTNDDGGTPGTINSVFDDTPDTRAPTLDSISVLSQTQLEVFFNEPLDQTSAELSSNYTIDAGITVNTVEFDELEPSQVVLTVSDLVSGEVKTLSVDGVADLSGNEISGGTIDFRYIEIEEANTGDVVINEFHASPNADSGIPNREFIELFNRSNKFIDVANWTYSDLSGVSSNFSSFILEPDSFLILTTNSGVDSFETYGDVIGVSNFQALNSGDSIIIRNSNGIIIHEIKYSTSTSGISTELINPNGPDYSFRNYGLSTNAEGGTPGSINSIFDDTPDTTPPTLDSISVISQTQLEIFFDEPLEEVSAENAGNYSIDRGITVINATRSETDYAKVVLTVSDLVSGEVRTLTVNGATDLSGNSISNATIDFRYINIEGATEGDVVINEFHASPNEESSIPNREYIELFNRSNKYIDVANWRYSDASDTSSAFPSFILEPDSFLILTTTSGVDLFEEYGNTIGIGSFSSLRSEEDSIIIMNENEIVIHEIAYSTSTSGISTELINPNGPDYSFRNYGLSTNSEGGTPGSINSIFDDTPDTTAPTLDSISVLSQTQLEIFFDEPLEEVSAENTANYNIDGGITVTNALRSVADFAKVVLTVSDLVSGDIRTLTVNGATDLSGNSISNATIDFRYINIEGATEGDVVINEFHASPNEESGIPNREYIELFNRSNKYIDVDDWRYSDASDTSSAFPSFVLEPDSFLILTTGSGVSLFEEYGNTIGIGSFSSLRSEEDSIIIMNENEIVIHEIAYSTSTSGISTELINPNGPDYSFRNYGLSTNSEGGTPGSINSIFDDTPDTTAPTLDSISVLSQTQLEIFFDEPLEEVSAENTANYSIDGGITVTNALRSMTDYAKVVLTVLDLVSGEVRTLTVNGATDLSGNAIANATIDFRYINIEEASLGDVVINEFHASPNEESGIPNREYIELFNRSNKYIDVANWRYSDASDTSSAFPSFILEPDSFLILTTGSGVPLFEDYGNAIGVGRFSSLRSSEDSIIIMNSDTVVIHEIAYSTSTSGISTELINPNGPDYSFRNYGQSANPEGGTPGSINSIFDDTPDTTAPLIESIVVTSSTELNVIFNEPLTKLTAETISNYAIDEVTISSALLYDTANFVVQLVVSELPSAIVKTLTINNVADLSGNSIAENSTIEFEYLATEEAVFGDILINEFLADPVDNNDDFIELWNVSDKFIDLTNWRIRDNAALSAGFNSFVIRPNDFVIIYDEDATVDYSSFGDAIAIPSLTLNNTNDQIELLSADTTSIAFIAYTDQPKEGISSELINPNDPCITELSYGASIDESGNTLARENSIFDDTPDTSPPMITSYNFDEGLTIRFSESMDIESLQDGTYEIDGLTINEVNTREDDLLSVEISFNENMVLGTLYELSVSNVTDCWGNVIDPTILKFGIGRTPTFNEILITEIMADPDPAIVLPDREYIEIYNSTNDIISLNEVAFSDESSSTILPSTTINPSSYLVLTTSTGAAEFLDGAVGVPGFPSLSNSGEQLVLSLGESLLFSVLYDKSWHSSLENEVGGVSLEMIDITNPCAEENNWTSSTDPQRGTPGKQNAVIGNVPDNFPPEMVSVIALNADSVRIDFDEKIDPTLIDLVTVAIEPDITVENINTDFLNPKSLFILLDDALEESLLYKLTLSNISDCNGNASDDQRLDFALPSVPSENQILLSEILFNPYTNGVDFVELYNNSDSYLDLRHWQLANLSDDKIANQKAISSRQLVFEPREFLALSIDPGILFTNYPKGNQDQFYQMESLPTYANSEGTVVLLNQDSIEVERFTYSSDFHYGLLNSVDGVSLERISYVATNDANNWRSASSTVGFATPGYQNSQSFEASVPKGTIEIEPKVFLPGNSGSGRDFTLISYQVETAGQFANIQVYDQTGRLVKTLAEGILLSNAGFVRWDGTTNSGALARMGYHVVLFEIYDSNGNSQTMKETVVVGRDF